MNYADKLKQKETTLLNLKAQAMAKKQSILDKYDSDDDPDMKPLIDVLNDSTNLEFQRISRWNNGDIHRIHYLVD